MKYAGYVAVPEEKIQLWLTQIKRSVDKLYSEHPDWKPTDYNIERYATHGASGMDKFCRKEIREQLHIPDSEVIERFVHQKRLVRKIGNVWYFEVETRPRRR